MFTPFSAAAMLVSHGGTPTWRLCAGQNISTNIHYFFVIIIFYHYSFVVIEENHMKTGLVNNVEKDHPT